MKKSTIVVLSIVAVFAFFGIWKWFINTFPAISG